MRQSLRCFIVVPTLGRGGAERQAVLLAKALSDRGLCVRLFVNGGADSLARDGLTDALAVDWTPSVLSVPAQLARLRGAVEDFVPDAVITFLRGAEGRFALVRAVSRAARRAAWIVASRGHIRLVHLVKSPAVTAANLVWLRATDRIVVNAAALAGNYLAIDSALAPKIEVVPNIMVPFPVDVAQARARVDGLIGGASRRPVIGCLGSFQDERNYILLADALAIVRRRVPGVHALVVGRMAGAWISDAARAFRARVAGLGLSDRVVLTGEIAGARALLAGLDVFALPSKLEGSSNALAEAMVAGVPTAAVPVSDAEVLLGGAGVVSHGYTPGAFAEAIVSALENAKSLQDRARVRGQELLAERAPGRVGARWAALLEEAVRDARTRR